MQEVLTYGERQQSTSMSQQRKNRQRQRISDARLPFKIVGYSIACERHPQRNEDAYLVDNVSGLVAVFDGVGGSAAGEIASQTAKRAALAAWHEEAQKLFGKSLPVNHLADCDSADFCSILKRVVENADERVRTEGAQVAGTDDLATTVAIAMFCQLAGANDYAMTYAHVGDSRVYLLPEQGPLKRLTIDDGLLGRLVESQMVTEEDARHIDQAMRAEDLSELEFSYFRLRGGITQALGGPLPPAIHLAQTPVAIGDRVLVCTDGIHDNLTDAEIESILRTASRDAAARVLVEHALQRSREERSTTIRAKPDDMSAIVVTRRF
jgi:PPM family protein phosphatase